MIKSLTLLLILISFGVLYGCEETRPEEDPLLTFVDGIGERIDANPSDCDKLGQSLQKHIQTSFEEDKTLARYLRQSSVGQKRFSEETEIHLETSLRKLHQAHARCKSNRLFIDALKTLEHSQDNP